MRLNKRCALDIGERRRECFRRVLRCKFQCLQLEVGGKERPAVSLWSKVLHSPVAVGGSGVLRLLVRARVAHSVLARRKLKKAADLAAWRLLRIKHTRRLRLSGPIGGAKSLQDLPLMEFIPRGLVGIVTVGHPPFV